MAKKKKTKEPLVVGTKVKAAIKAAGCKCAGDFVPALNEAVYGLVEAAAERAKANRRSTVRPQDL